MNSIPRKCPSCSSPMVVTQLGCTACDTTVVGRFELNPFLRLSPESLDFLETFIRNRGNVKEMERSSGQSYWAIRKRLDEVIAEMGFDIEPAVDILAQRRQEILNQLSQGEIDVQEATRLLTQLGKTGP
ncbi:MAG: DUF2089 domain-containing protein [Anaerolineales bacterium]|nr:DUF2089 domain-containing protein [Anaerolineales bacterium]